MSPRGDETVAWSGEADRGAAGVNHTTGGDVEASLVAAQRLVDRALAGHRRQVAQGLALVEHHGSDEHLWPFFARFLRRAVHGSAVLHAVNCSWAQGGSADTAIGRLQEGILDSCGGRLQILADSKSVVDTDIVERLGELEERGARVRVSNAELPTMLILDQTAAVTLPVPKYQAGQDDSDLVLIRVPEIVTAVNNVVAVVWNASVELRMFRERLTILGGLTGRVLRMLQMGYKDETAARILGLSVRTYRRHVAAMMERLEATSRFQAGARASMLGLPALLDTDCLVLDSGC